MSEIRATDIVRDSHGDVAYEQRWACEPPPEGSTFRVIRDEWSTDAPVVRTIFEWEGPRDE